MQKVILATLTLLTVVTPAWSDDFCKNIEYAEIKDMDKTELLEAFKHDATKLFYGREGAKCDQNIKAYTRQLKKRYKYKDADLGLMELEYKAVAWKNSADKSSQ